MKLSKIINNNILLVDKTKGLSSFNVIRILRMKSGIRKMGHAGTLDPAASGLLIIGVEKVGTKKMTEFLQLPKTYKMEILLGKKTDTGDLDGRVIEEKKFNGIKKEKALEVLKSLEGEVDLTVPIYSALKLNGKRFYHYAREGKKIDLPKRKTKINSLKLLDINKNIIKVEMDCGHGTYARSVGEEIGKRLGYPATLQNLRRTKIGEFSVENAMKIS